MTTTATCNDCPATGSLKFLATHDCASNQAIAANGGRCEDYPCCGHTDGDGCIALESHTSEYWHDWFQDMRRRGYDDHDIDMMLDGMEG